MNINTRPDLAYEIVELSTKFGKATLKDMRQAARLIKKARDRPLRIKFKHLGDLRELKFLVYGDAAHASLPDGTSSCGGKLVLLLGKDGKCAPLMWGSNKLKRIARSPLAAETMAMLDAVEEALWCRFLLDDIIGFEKLG